MSGLAGDHLLTLLLFGASAWLARGWVSDYRAALAGKPNDKPFPGATPASARALPIASLGALVILAAETGGEKVLGLSAEQSQVTVLFSLYSVLGAPVIEEVLFREYLVIEDRGPLAGGGKHLYRILIAFPPAEPIAFEIPIGPANSWQMKANRCVT